MELNATSANEAAREFELGILYSTGKGVPLDYVMAHQFFNIAAARGVAAARVLREDLAIQMTPAQVAEALRRARQWLSAKPAPRLLAA